MNSENQPVGQITASKALLQFGLIASGTCTRKPAPQSGKYEGRCEPDSGTIADVTRGLTWGH